MLTLSDVTALVLSTGESYPPRAIASMQRFVRGQQLLFASQFSRAYALGIRLHRQQAPAACLTYMQQLQQAHDLTSWVALVGLCHGLFADTYREREAEEAFIALKELLPR